MLFVRVVEGNLTCSGIRTRKIYIYESVPYGKGCQYDFASDEIYKKIRYGSYYKDKHFILFKWEKWQILDELFYVFGDNFAYVFE